MSQDHKTLSSIVCMSLMHPSVSPVLVPNIQLHLDVQQTPEKERAESQALHLFVKSLILHLYFLFWDIKEE